MKIKFNNIIFLFIITITSFFCLTNEVNAINFTSKKPGTSEKWQNCWNKNNYKLGNTYVISPGNKKSCKSGENYDFVKWVSGNSSKYAYCADRTRPFSSKGTFKADDNYSNAKNCKYYVKSTTDSNKLISKSDGDCSSIVGYIIAAAWSDKFTDGLKSQKKWHYAQSSIWTFLGKFGPSTYSQYNTRGASNAWKAKGKIYKILLHAFEQYAEAHEIIKDSEKDDINFSVSVDNSEFRFAPQGDNCNEGSYITSPITIKNNESRTISISITIPHDSISICKYHNPTDCVTNSTGGTLKTDLGAGQSLKVFMSTKFKLTEEINFKVYASYEEQSTRNVKIYNSKRYSKKGKQGMIVKTESTTTNEAIITHNSLKNIQFTQATITHHTCPSNEDSGVTSNIYSSNQESNPISKVCANDATLDVSGKANINDYTVYFSDCSCLTLNFANGNSVRILLDETTGFRFGNLNPKEVYPGGSFKFFESSHPGDGITTAYESNLTWEYADYIGEVPYYYNKNDSSKKNATDIENQIETILKGKLKDEINIKLKTLNSNNSTIIEDINSENEDKVTELSIKIDVNEKLTYDSTKQMFNISLNDIKLPNAYLSSDRDVIYGASNEKHKIDGGNEYYVPINYKSNHFPFDIVTTNLSVLSSGNFWYNAECDIDIDTENYLYGINGIRYRSITTSNPFPKATTKEDLPYNWQNWYWNNTINIARIKNTYQAYKNNNPLYKINIDNNKLNQIKNITTLYDNWDNIIHENLSNGSSSFVTNNFETYPTNNTSYCQIGRFHSDCDN